MQASSTRCARLLIVGYLLTLLLFTPLHIIDPFAGLALCVWLGRSVVHGDLQEAKCRLITAVLRTRLNQNTTT
jgi:hypothetical protein